MPGNTPTQPTQTHPETPTTHTDTPSDKNTTHAGALPRGTHRVPTQGETHPGAPRHHTCVHSEKMLPLGALEAKPGTPATHALAAWLWSLCASALLVLRASPPTPLLVFPALRPSFSLSPSVFLCVCFSLFYAFVSISLSLRLSKYR